MRVKFDAVCQGIFWRCSTSTCGLIALSPHFNVPVVYGVACLTALMLFWERSNSADLRLVTVFVSVFLRCQFYSLRNRNFFVSMLSYFVIVRRYRINDGNSFSCVIFAHRS